ncbi:MAG: inositol monophosphatase family protein, partial [Actinomycetota bacterium]
MAVDLKGDLSPVTAADRGAEELLRQLIEREFPQDGVLGEEFGERAGTSGFRWILDPVDGTKSFVHGVPPFGTLIGMEHNGRAVLGVCRLPALN